MYTSAREYYLTKCRTDDQRIVLNSIYDICEKRHHGNLVYQDLGALDIERVMLDNALKFFVSAGIIQDVTPWPCDVPMIFIVPY